MWRGIPCRAGPHSLSTMKLILLDNPAHCPRFLIGDPDRAPNASVQGPLLSPTGLLRTGCLSTCNVTKAYVLRISLNYPTSSQVFNWRPKFGIYASVMRYGPLLLSLTRAGWAVSLAAYPLQYLILCMCCGGVWADGVYVQENRKMRTLVAHLNTSIKTFSILSCDT